MKKLTATKLNDVVMLSFNDKDENTCCIMLRKVAGEWTCPTMTYTKTTPAHYIAAYGLKNGWKPNKAMIKAAEKALKR